MNILVPTNQIITSSETFIQTVADSITRAVGDDIIEDIQAHHLVTGNGNATRTWDYINTNIYYGFKSSDVIANPTKRGPWELLPFFERATGNIYSAMREERFSTIKKQRPGRKNAHYLDALTNSLNGDLVANIGQARFLDFAPFEDEKIHEIVEKIFSDLNIPGNIIKHHGLILFSSQNFQLFSLRCCVINGDLEIVEEADWSNYIKAGDSVVTEKVNKDDIGNDPSAGLNFKQKAKDRIDQKEIGVEKKRNVEEREN